MRGLSLSAGILTAAAGALLCWSCVTDECLGNSNSLPCAGFYAASTGQQISVSALTVYGLHAPNDTLLVSASGQLSKLYLPFRIDQPSTTYVIHYEDEAISSPLLNDTVTFDYEIIPYFVSSACGASYRYRMEDIRYTRHLIDSVACPAGLIDNTDAVNLEFYYRTE